ncbi:hypothetical protein [Rhizobium sp. NXC24]|uniref:hypothetical protein n=1 Tax=Rhizobium sp. NXC24 TaxID=2048897 RepID=UPI00131A5D4D|nr:hypothetical protein [Rhizobium sp. NXC24]
MISHIEGRKALAEPQTLDFKGIGGLAAFISDALQKLDGWLKRPEVQQAFEMLLKFPYQIDQRAKNRFRFLRQGLLPSLPLCEHVAESQPVEAGSVSQRYAASLEAMGLLEDARIMEAIGKFVQIVPPVYSLRAIFPEVEAVVRRHFYEPGEEGSLASVFDMRLGMVNLYIDAPLGTAGTAMAAERFIFTNLGAIDFAYARSNEDIRQRYRRAFAKIPNRHRVCHGVPEEYDEKHVINGLTILYIAVIACHLILSQSEESPRAADKPIGKLFDEKRKEVRSIDREIFSFIRAAVKNQSK